MITLSFHGAAQAVTGSCFLLKTERAGVLIDCGMVQGSKSERELNYRAFPFAIDDIDALVLTHAHIDHSGLVPKLTKAGFAGPIFATPATSDLCRFMLPDSGHIQEMEVDQLNRRNARRGRERVTSIYTAAEATRALDQFAPVSYGVWKSVADGVRVRFWNAGHLLGSASIEIEVDRGKSHKPLRLLASGDIGPDNKLLHPDPEAAAGFDYVICESTYGDRDRQDVSEERRRAALLVEVEAAMKAGGAMIIPSFAVERTQEMLVDLAFLIDSRAIRRFPIFIDSPLATRASETFGAHARDLVNGDALVEAMRAPYVRFTESVEASKAIDRLRGFHVIISASGMCDAGRVRHHLKAWLWKKQATVMIVGFQAQGTLGRILQDGADRVRIMGDEVEVRARIRTLDMYSGHADGAGLGEWMSARMPVSAGIFLTHGEESAIAGLAERLADLVPRERIHTPQIDDVYALEADGARLIQGAPRRRVSPEAIARQDWSNEMSKLILDLNEAVEQAADARSKSAILRRIRRALEEA
ncbi:MAG: MBL fold metallo-hydrolase [Salinarimonadaceae bacterium]|nr:MAG: MBL fold metallo-hydrolase [Salinarimonadaceae bacterium]